MSQIYIRQRLWHIEGNWKALHEKSSEKLPDNVFLASYLAGRGTVEESEMSHLVLN